MAIRITLEFNAPKKRKEKKVWHGEAEARECLGKCYVIDNSIGKVVKIEKRRGEDYWQVHFRKLVYRKPDGFCEAEGLEDYFAMQAATLYSAVAFKRSAYQIPGRALHRARKISKEAGEEIDRIIKAYEAQSQKAKE